jgi:hypothetical protein
MDIKRVGTQASGKGPADWFTGVVRILYFKRLHRLASRGQASLSSRRAYCVAHSSAWSDAHRNSRSGLGATGRWTRAEHSSG